MSVDINDLAESVYSQNNVLLGNLKLEKDTILEYIKTLKACQKNETICDCANKRKNIIATADQIQDSISSKSKILEEKKELLKTLERKVISLNGNLAKTPIISNIDCKKSKINYVHEIDEINERYESLKTEHTAKLNDIMNTHQEKLSELRNKMTDLRSEKISCDEEKEEIYFELQGARMNNPKNTEDSDSLYSQLDDERVEIEKMIVQKDEEIQIIRDRIKKMNENSVLLSAYTNEEKQKNYIHEIKIYVVVENTYKKLDEYLGSISPLLDEKLTLSNKSIESETDFNKHSVLISKLIKTIENIDDDVKNNFNERKKELKSLIRKNELLLGLELDKTQDTNKENSPNQFRESGTTVKRKFSQ